MKNKQHILFLTPGFPKNEEDTRCISALHLFLSELKKRDLFEISVMSFHYPYKAKDYSWNGIKVYALGGDNKKGFRRVLLLKRAFKLAQKIGKTKPIDRVHSFWLGECAWIGNKISKKYKIPHSCTLMGQDALSENNYLKKINPLPTLITLSKIHEEVLFKNSGIKSDHRIPWGVKENDEYHSTRVIDILGVGNLTELKNFDRFLQIIHKLKGFRSSIRVEIIGEGKTNKLQALIKKLELEGNVSILAERTREEILLKMQESKCLLHCSQYESFGMVIPEALSCGTAVYSTPVGIAPEIKSVQLYRSNEEAVELLNQFFNSKERTKRIVPFHVKTTVDSYINSVFLASN